MKKNNLIWLHSHFSYWMGGTKFIYRVISEIKKSGQVNKIYVLVENSSDFATKQYQDLGVELVSLKSLSSNSPIYWLFLPVFLIFDYLKIKVFLKKKNLNNQNTVLINSMFPMNVLAIFLKFKNIQNCYEPFAFFYDKSFSAQFSTVKQLFIKCLALFCSPIDKWATRKASKVLTLNNITQSMIRSVYGIDSIKTQAGVDSKLFKPYKNSQLKKQYLNNKIVIHSTDYSPIKRTDLIIKAFAKVAKKIPEAKLLITTTIEDDKRKKLLENLTKKLGVKNKVEFLGFLPIKLLPQYYSLATVMVQGAFSEKSGTTSMSLPVKEAMACETPAIRPDVGGEDVIDGKTGFLVDPRNTSLLANKIEILLLDKKLANKMGKEARIFIKNKYTWKNTAKVFIKQIVN